MDLIFLLYYKYYLNTEYTELRHFPEIIDDNN